jgi:hypothetical protein
MNPMNSAQTMTQRKNSNLNGSAGNGHGGNGHGAMINALRKLYDPVLEESVPDVLLRIASMTREEAQKGLAKREGKATAEGNAEADKPESDAKR